MKKKSVVIYAVLLWAVFICALYVYADVDTGTATDNNYFYNPAEGDWGTDFINKQNAAKERADRGIRSANIIKMHAEYPTSGDKFWLGKAVGQMEIDEVTVVLVRDANENITFNIAHGTDRSGEGTDLLAADYTAHSTTEGETITTFSDPTIDTNEHIWLHVTGNSGPIEAMDMQVDPSVS